MVPARLTPIAVHALLDDDPMPVIGDDETVQIEVEPVLHRGAVDLGDETACGCQSRAVKPHPLTDRLQFVRGLPRMRAAPAANMQAELASERCETALQRADDAGGDAGGMPIHP